ncbi:MAG: hypothetical protein DYG94_07550 [Leptolyngbya sp. PLA3]|nr:MAG: hypothetical protein EDM82_10545 [Cyanobacteria bacterium CYA]MCE7968585.1 hypothetical protein [Leptolyngbya sp. PL-A3]
MRWRKLRPDGLSTPASDTLAIRGEALTKDRRIAVDVKNLNGSVTVLVSDRYDTAHVYARAGWRGKYSKAEWEEVRNEDWVVAEHVIEEGNSILRVLSQAAPDVDPPVRTDIRILLPACDGVHIRNAGGSVKVVGAGGAHTIESGFETGPGGSIEVKTSRDITDPINLRTSDGWVDLVLDQGSSGTIDLQTDEGKAFFSSKFGRTTDVKADAMHWTGVWNASSNPITLRTLSGDARVRVVDKPEMYSVGLRQAMYP